MSISGVILSPNVYSSNQTYGNKRGAERKGSANIESGANYGGQEVIPNSAMNSCFSGCGDLESYPFINSDCGSSGGWGEVGKFSLMNPMGQYEIYAYHEEIWGNVVFRDTTKINLSTGELSYTILNSYPYDPSKNINDKGVLPKPNSCTLSQLKLYKQSIDRAKKAINWISSNGVNPGCGSGTHPDFHTYIDFLTCANNKIVVSIEEDINKELISGVKVYPNPASSALNIQLPKVAGQDVNVKIFNIAGQEVKSLTIPKGEKAIEWNVKEGNISSGTYIYQISVNNAVVNGKIQIINR